MEKEFNLIKDKEEIIKNCIDNYIIKGKTEEEATQQAHIDYDAAMKMYEKAVKEEENPVLTSINLRKGEADIRKLSSKDYKQLMWRIANDLWVFGKQETMALNKIEFMFGLYLKSLNIDVEAEWAKEQEEIIKGLGKK